MPSLVETQAGLSPTPRTEATPRPPKVACWQANLSLDNCRRLLRNLRGGLAPRRSARGASGTPYVDNAARRGSCKHEIV
jgi:hypothetical protein